MKIHKAATALPDMTAEEFAALKADIETNGLLCPVERYEGAVIDGRHRLKACKELGIEPEFVDVDLCGQSPASYVWSLNGARRHLTASQRAAVAVDMLPQLRTEAKQRMSDGGKNKGVGLIPPLETGKARDKAAEIVNVDPTYVSKAEKLKNESPEAFAKVKAGEITITQANREIKDQKVTSRRAGNARKASKAKSLESCEMTFATILIDPPWDWGDEGDVNQLGRAKPDYGTMPLEEIAALPLNIVSDIDCHLYCWVTNRSMPKVFSLFDAWGFRYVTLLTWPKTHFGMGNYFRGQTEHIAFGVKGSQMLNVKDASTLLPSWKRGEQHSSKPVEIYEFIERCSPGPYLEMFSRQERDGWFMWGQDS